MGKIFDWIMTDGNWEETQRISLYKKLGKSIDGMSKNQIKELIGRIK